MRKLLILVVLFSLCSSGTKAGVPTLLNYQGQLRNMDGDLVSDGNYSLTITIYDALVGGNSKWTEVHNVMTTDGSFSILLGSVNPIMDSVFAGENRYLGIKVGNDAELTPRWQLSAVAYANRISTVDGASGGSILSNIDIEGDLIVSGKASIGPNHEISGMNTFVTGKNNIVSADFATVGGGHYNYARGPFSVIAGGGGAMDMDSNMALGNHSSILGGGRNRTSGAHSAIGGGCCNTITSGGQFSNINGGQANTVSGKWATVPGGLRNTAEGQYSFAAGRRAIALHVGTFVWADSINVDYESQRDNQFLTRATGGNRFDVNNSQWIEFYDNSVELVSTSCGANLSIGGTWVNASDKNQKENFATINKSELLDKISKLPITVWNYKSEDKEVRHIGPMAQDFRALFGVGSDEKHISTIDPAGIALVGIQELTEKNKKLEASQSLLIEKIEQLQKRLEMLEEKP